MRSPGNKRFDNDYLIPGVFFFYLNLRPENSCVLVVNVLKPVVFGTKVLVSEMYQSGIIYFV
jgi:hypothetical protein